MGWAALQSILETLQREGMAPDTPVALVQWGTWKKQQTVDGVLSDVVARAKEAGLTPPVVAVIGPVAGLRKEIRWFDRQPLFGKKVLITFRPPGSPSVNCCKRGAEPLECRHRIAPAGGALNWTHLP